MIYLDHICDNDLIQDLLCVIRVPDEVLLRLTAELPEAKSISIISDN